MTNTLLNLSCVAPDDVGEPATTEGESQSDLQYQSSRVELLCQASQGRSGAIRSDPQGRQSV
jgi:hypothetical protein